jgi:hypothetical protein
MTRDRAHGSASRTAEVAVFATALVFVIAFHALVANRFFGAGATHVGHDYSYFLPQLLNGCFWRAENGPFAIPWFTPALGGGIPFYANPSCIYASLPQLAAFVIGPLAAVRITLIAFGAIGFAGTYALARRTLHASAFASLFGAVAFALNGFFLSRMLIGHLGFHSCMLLPALAHFVLRPLPSGPSATSERSWSIARDAVLIGAGFAYVFQSGNFYGVLPALIAIGGLAAIVSLRGGDLRGSMTRLALGGALALCLSAAKLAAGLAFVGSFPRNEYPLPGANNLGSGALIAVRALFFEPPVELAHDAIVHFRWRLARHELEYGVTWVPLVMLCAWSTVALARRIARGRSRLEEVDRGTMALETAGERRSTNVRRNLAFAVLVAALLLPIALNTYEEHWTDLLERVPILGSSSTLVRCFLAYLPIVAAAAALAIDGALPRRARAPIAILATLVLAATQVLRDWSYYANQPYDPRPVERAYAAIDARVPPVAEIRVALDANGKPSFALDRNDALCTGGSQMLPYEPIFGYRLESFPFGSLHPGPTSDEQDGRLNVKNPALFLFPNQNGGAPGDAFRADQRNDAEALLSYRPFPFEKPLRQHAAEALNVIALIGTVVFAAAWIVRAARSARRAGAHGERR